MADELELPPEEAEEGAPEWVVTFGDMMSLLLCFFILLLSFSETDAGKYKELAGSLEKAFGVQKVLEVYGKPLGMKIVARDFDQAYVEQAPVGPMAGAEQREVQDYKRLLESLHKQGVLALEEEAEYFIIRLIGQATFTSGKATIESRMVPVLMTIGDIIRRSEREIIVAGHTDNIPLKGGAYDSNLALSAARAAAVVQFFIEHGFVPPERIATMGYGEYRPIADNDTEANRQKNRRVDIKLSLLRPASAMPVSGETNRAPLGENAWSGSSSPR
ncbi:MAG: flagellar motor protein MotB [Candidatus Tectimicrobiota bacterium]